MTNQLRLSGAYEIKEVLAKTRAVAFHGLVEGDEIHLAFDVCRGTAQVKVTTIWGTYSYYAGELTNVINRCFVLKEVDGL